MNHTLLHRFGQIEAEMTCRSDDCIQGRKPCPTPHLCLDLRHVAALPVSRDIGVEAALPSRFVNEPQPQDDTPAPSLRWFLVVVVLAFALAAIFSVHTYTP